jgi:hypothetical protein
MLAASQYRTFCLLSKNVKIRINKTVIFPVVLYGCETWPLTLRGEHRPRVFENRVLRRIFRPKRDEVTNYAVSHFRVQDGKPELSVVDLVFFVVEIVAEVPERQHWRYHCKTHMLCPSGHKGGKLDPRGSIKMCMGRMVQPRRSSNVEKACPTAGKTCL